jgi:regulatory protein
VGRASSPSTASAYQAALRRLAHRDHSEHELRAALGRRGHSAEEIEAVLARLRRAGYVDDSAFALRFARSRLEHRGLGRFRIRAALRAKGVERRLAEQGLATALGEVSEVELLERLARRYWERHTRDAPEKRLRKLWGFLLRRGFPAGLVAERLRGLWPDRGDDLELLLLSREQEGA